MYKTFEDMNLHLWVTHYCESGKIYYITSDKFRDEYCLWKDNNGKPKLTKYKDADPTNLYKYCKE